MSKKLPRIDRERLSQEFRKTELAEMFERSQCRLEVDPQFKREVAFLCKRFGCSQATAIRTAVEALYVSLTRGDKKNRGKEEGNKGSDQ